MANKHIMGFLVRNKWARVVVGIGALVAASGAGSKWH